MRRVWVQEGSEHPLDTPVLRGPKRNRRYPMGFKLAVTKASAEGALQDRGPQLQALAAMLKRQGVAAIRGGHEFIFDRCGRYWQSCMNLGRSPDQRIYSVAWDATRCAGKDMVYMRLYLPRLGLGVGCLRKCRP